MNIKSNNLVGLIGGLAILILTVGLKTIMPFYGTSSMFYIFFRLLVIILPIPSTLLILFFGIKLIIKGFKKTKF
jgi:hypothetical protein